MPIVQTFHSTFLGMAIVLAMYHLHVSIRKKDISGQMCFLFMCCGLFAYSGSNFLLYQTNLPERYADVIIAQAWAMALFHFGLAGHMTAISGIKKHYLALFALALAVFISLMHAFPELVDPGNFDHTIKRISSPWGEDIFLLHPGMTAFANSYQALLASSYIVTIFALRTICRKGEKKKARIIAAGLGIIVMSLCYDAMIFNLALPLPFMADFGFTAMTALLSLITSQGFIDASLLAEKLAASEKTILDQNFRLTNLNDELSESIRNLEEANDAFEIQNKKLVLTLNSLKESEERYRTLIETSPDPIIMIDLMGNILSVNINTARLYGAASSDEFIETVRNVITLVHKDDRDRAVKNMKERIATKTSGRSEYRLFTRDGSLIFVEIHSSPILDSQGNPAGFVSIIRDNTERMKAEEKLRQQEEYKRILFDESLIPMVILDHETGSYFDCNDAAVRIFGYSSRNQLIGKRPEDISVPEIRDGVSMINTVQMHIAEARHRGYSMFQWTLRRPGNAQWAAEAHLSHFTHQADP
jgi:PAS domain S-box-containing protein